MYWMDVALEVASLVLSGAILFLVWLLLRSDRRAEQAGEERLEMLREQQERLAFMREERRHSNSSSNMQRWMMGRQSDSPSESNGHSESEQPKPEVQETRNIQHD